MINFEKISEETFRKTLNLQEKDLISLYRSYPLPSRSTPAAAGYDFFLLADLNIPAGGTVLVPTGVKAAFPPDLFLLLVLRSSAGIKHHLRLTNQVGIIDADYCNNKENEGQIFYSLENLGLNDKFFSAGDHLVQGIFLPYQKIDTDIPRKNSRTGKY